MCGCAVGAFLGHFLPVCRGRREGVEVLRNGVSRKNYKSARIHTRKAGKGEGCSVYRSKKWRERGRAFCFRRSAFSLL